MRLPIVTIREQDNLWSACTWNSDNTGLLDHGKYKDRKLAEDVAKKFAELNELVYVAPESTFITVFPYGKAYVVAEHPFNGKVKGRGWTSLSFKKVCEEALKIGKDENKPVAPYFYVAKRLTISEYYLDMLKSIVEKYSSLNLSSK